MLSLKSNPATARRGCRPCLVAASPQGSIASPFRRGTAGAQGKAMRSRLAHLGGRMRHGSAEPKQKSLGRSTPTPLKTFLGEPPLRELDALSGPLDPLSSMQLSSMSSIEPTSNRTDFESNRLRIEPTSNRTELGIAVPETTGGAEGNRTPDLCSAIAALSHLSYGPAMGAGI